MFPSTEYFLPALYVLIWQKFNSETITAEKVCEETMYALENKSEKKWRESADYGAKKTGRYHSDWKNGGSEKKLAVGNVMRGEKTLFADAARAAVYKFHYRKQRLAC